MEPLPPVVVPHISVEQADDPRPEQATDAESQPQQMLLHINNKNNTNSNGTNINNNTSTHNTSSSNNENSGQSSHASHRSSEIVLECEDDDDIECIVFLSEDDDSTANHESATTTTTEQRNEDTTTDKLERRFEELSSIWTSVKLRTPSPEALRRHTYSAYTGKLGSPEREQPFTPLSVPRSMWRSPVKAATRSRSPVHQKVRSGSTDDMRVASSFRGSKRTPSTTPMQRNAGQRKSLGSSNMGDRGEQRGASMVVRNAEFFPNPPPNNLAADAEREKASHSAISVPMVRLSNARLRRDTSADNSGGGSSNSKIIDSPSLRRASSHSGSNRVPRAPSPASFCSAAVVGSSGKMSNNIGSNRQPSATRQQPLHAAVGTISPSRVDRNGAATRSPNRTSGATSRKSSPQTTPTRVGTRSPRSGSLTSPQRTTTTVTYKQCPACGYLKVRFDANFCQSCGVRCTGIA